VSTFHLFAYGTLRRGGDAARRLAGCEFAGTGTVGGTLYDIDGRFPALLLYGDAPVHGDIWRCPAELLLELDRYEGVADGLFIRKGVTAEAGHETVPCWVYTAGPALSRKLLPDRRIASGEWRPHGVGRA
jgi:gamma-glutamylcyclotransferase (GGCT)/AIG2-like uncharacterized protein YtfP